MRRTCDPVTRCLFVGVLLAERAVPDAGSAYPTRPGASSAAFFCHLLSRSRVSASRLFMPLPLMLALRALCAAASSLSSLLPCAHHIFLAIDRIACLCT